MRTVHYATIDSTNLEARRLAAAGETGPLWIRAGQQTHGKGRLGRRWVSEPGNLYATLVLPTAAPPAAYGQLGFVAALAVAEACGTCVAPGRISLKWPNDCLLDGAKFCGILAEVLAPGLLAIGIGINVAQVPADLPYKAERLAGADLDGLFAALQASLTRQLALWDAGTGFGAIRTAWTARCHHLGQPITVDGAPGIFAGLAADGALLMETGTSLRAVYAGDVRVEYQAP